MDKKKIKLYERAYDSLDDLNSKEHYLFDDLMETIEKKALSQEYYFALNDKTQKWKLKKCQIKN